MYNYPLKHKFSTDNIKEIYSIFLSIDDSSTITINKKSQLEDFAEIYKVTEPMDAIDIKMEMYGAVIHRGTYLNIDKIT